MCSLSAPVDILGSEDAVDHVVASLCNVLRLSGVLLELVHLVQEWASSVIVVERGHHCHMHIVLSNAYPDLSMRFQPMCHAGGRYRIHGEVISCLTQQKGCLVRVRNICLAKISVDGRGLWPYLQHMVPKLLVPIGCKEHGGVAQQEVLQACRICKAWQLQQVPAQCVLRSAVILVAAPTVVHSACIWHLHGILIYDRLATSIYSHAV